MTGEYIKVGFDGLHVDWKMCNRLSAIHQIEDILVERLNDFADRRDIVDIAKDIGTVCYGHQPGLGGKRTFKLIDIDEPVLQTDHRHSGASCGSFQIRENVRVMLGDGDKNSITRPERLQNSVHRKVDRVRRVGGEDDFAFFGLQEGRYGLFRLLQQSMTSLRNPVSAAIGIASLDERTSDAC